MESHRIYDLAVSGSIEFIVVIWDTRSRRILGSRHRWRGRQSLHLRSQWRN